MDIVHEIFQNNCNEQGFALPKSLGEALIEDEKTASFKSSVAREPRGFSEIDKETFGQVYERIKKSIYSRLDWSKLEQYFSRRGQPMTHSRSNSKQIASGAVSVKTKAVSHGGRSSVHPEVKQFMQSFPRFPRNDGKGRYKITVPEQPEFEKRAKNKTKTIREKRNEEEQEMKEREHQYEMAS